MLHKLNNKDIIRGLHTSKRYIVWQGRTLEDIGAVTFTNRLPKDNKFIVLSYDTFSDSTALFNLANELFTSVLNIWSTHCKQDYKSFSDYLRDIHHMSSYDFRKLSEWAGDEQIETVLNVNC